MTEPDLVFVTGSIRSGTTLLTRLLAQTVSSVPMPQPVPLFLVRLKAEFLKQKMAPDWHIKYPLADDIFATSFDQSSFTSFVDEYFISKATALEWLQADQNYSGVMSEPESGLAQIEHWSGGGLIDFLREYLASGLGGAQPTIWKEAFAESYLPYLIRNAVPSVIIIRDPRDVVLSQSAGSAASYVGAVRPLLYQIRQWRKSVAWALWLEEQTGGSVIRYEDLVAAPEATLNHFSGALRLKHSQSKKPDNFQPGSNSSFGSFSKIDGSAVGRFKTLLPDSIARFIEAACLPEMRYFGYKNSMSDDEAMETLTRLDIDPYPTRLDLKAYEYGPLRCEEERSRMRSLRQNSSEFDPMLHLTPQAYTKLRDQF